MTIIRKASTADCRELAEIQVNSYRTAYARFFPPGFYDAMTIGEQAQDWIEWLTGHPEDVLLVAQHATGGLLGYVLARPQPEIYPGYDAEIMALHVRAEAQRQGVGGSLLRSAVSELAARGCRSVMLSTLEGNAIRQWYERLGGHLIGEKPYNYDGWQVVEVVYGWPQIETLQEHDR